MRLTVRGLVVLSAAPLLYVAGELLGFALFRALGGIALGAVLAGLAVAIHRPRVTVRRELYPNRVESGRPALALLRVRNPGTARHPAFIAKDLLGDMQHEVTVRELPPGATTSHRYQLPTQRRGRRTVGPLILERRDPLGLVYSSVVAGDTATLWVHPRRHPVAPLQIGWPRHHHEGPSSPDPLSGSTDLRQVREYVVGDELRHVHWKAMARTGTLMVREYADPAQPRFTALLDNRLPVLSPAAFEEAVEVAASLVFAAITAGHRTRLVSTCGQLDLESTAGLTGPREFLDRLAELGQAADSHTALTVSGGAVVFISGAEWAADRRLLAVLATNRATVSVVDLRPDGQNGRLAGHTISATSAAEAIQLWNGAVGQ